MASIGDAQRALISRYIYADEALRLPHLRCRVDLGDRTAIVKLARLYEIGDWLPRSETREVELYDNVVQDRPTVVSIYSPPVRIGGSGLIILLPNSAGGLGNADTKYRLGTMLLDGRGVARDAIRGQALVSAAMKQGFREDADSPMLAR